MIWQQDYVCWKCRDRIGCPEDQPWSWLRGDEAQAFEAKHAACDDGESVGVDLIFMED